MSNLSKLTKEAPRTRRILLVDDEPDILESLQDLLSAAIDHVDVDVAKNGEEGVKKLGASRYDLLVSDFKMPGMDGLEFLKIAKRDAPSTPRILMTAFPDLKIAIEAINEAAIENFFTKPLDPDEVVRVIESMLSGQEGERQRNQAFARAMDLARKGKQ